jgi:hypothetical protein
MLASTHKNQQLVTILTYTIFILDSRSQNFLFSRKEAKAIALQGPKRRQVSPAGLMFLVLFLKRTKPIQLF